MKKIFCYLQFFLIIFFNQSAAFGQKEPFISPLPQISSENEKLFMARVADGKALSLAAPESAQQDPKLSEVWSGNRPGMLSSINKVNLTYGKEGEVNSTFDLNIEFLADGMIIKHSNPYYGNERGGFKLTLQKNDKSKKFYFRGKNGQSIVMFVPSFSAAEKARGVLVCPRDFGSGGSREEKSSLQSSGYKLSGATAEVKAEMNAYLQNPVDYVLAQAKLIVSPGVLPPKNYFDQSYSKDSSVTLTYKEVPDGVVSKFEDYSNITLGMENFLSLHFSSGFKRLSKQLAVTYVKEVNLPDNQEVVLKAKDIVGTEMQTELQLRGIPLEKQGLISTKLLGGPCNLVLYQVTPIIHEYLKEEFSVPANVTD